MLIPQAFEDRHFTERGSFLLRRLWLRASTTSAGSDDFLKAAPLRSPCSGLVESMFSTASYRHNHPSNYGSAVCCSAWFGTGWLQFNSRPVSSSIFPADHIRTVPTDSRHVAQCSWRKAVSRCSCVLQRLAAGLAWPIRRGARACRGIHETPPSHYRGRDW